MEQVRFSFMSNNPPARQPLTNGVRAIEADDFPFEHLSEIAEIESWRKEINRPVYHIHKWWAQRLGSVFRAIVLATFAPSGTDIQKAFYAEHVPSDAVVFDPFMGSGTTLGEALKLGYRAIGRDINPVAHFLVRNALSVHSREDVMRTFKSIERDVAPAIQRFYEARLPNSERATVLYYFWVKHVPCPSCLHQVDLFSSYIFAKHAYASRKPDAQALCPHCGEINTVRYDAKDATCVSCNESFNPAHGPAKGAKATCPKCAHEFAIAKTVKASGVVPNHRMYAKLVLLSDGSKRYLPATQHDHDLYKEAIVELKRHANIYPDVAIAAGHNTNQVLNYAYTHWHQMFNPRQLLCITLIAERVRKISDERLRDLFICLLSGALEFNNMFASYKGEGTGAVRHMFSNHILKPERVPIEANVWGTSKSSGAFSTLFKSRILRAIDYCENPFEVRVAEKNGKKINEKVSGISRTLGFDIASDFADFSLGKAVYISCGDSSKTDIATESVDAVITDPPFFDNVHYSELADFFYVWQRHLLGLPPESQATTRSNGEVQHKAPQIFCTRLQGVWAECHRVLKPDGLLVFSYHHSRAEGWYTILQALVNAGFAIVAVQPIKAEMSGATPKSQAAEPIDLDVILVCRDRRAITMDDDPVRVENAAAYASRQIQRFNAVGRKLSRNDVRVIVMAHLIKKLSQQSIINQISERAEAEAAAINLIIENLHAGQVVLV